MSIEYTFKGQHEGEEVVEVVSVHPYVLYTPGFKAIGVLAVGVVILLFVPSIYLLSIILFVLAIFYFFNSFYTFKETVFLITNQRLFSVEQKGFFQRKIVEVSYKNIIDLSSETQGFAKVMLKYGDLIIRTAGAKEGGDIVLKNIPDPYYYQQKIAEICADK